MYLCRFSTEYISIFTYMLTFSLPDKPLPQANATLILYIVFKHVVILVPVLCLACCDYLPRMWSSVFLWREENISLLCDRCYVVDSSWIGQYSCVWVLSVYVSLGGWVSRSDLFLWPVFVLTVATRIFREGKFVSILKLYCGLFFHGPHTLSADLIFLAPEDFYLQIFVLEKLKRCQNIGRK